MTPNHSKLTGIDDLKNGLEILSKTVIGAVALIYVLGLVSESVYLSHYNVSSFNLLRVNYILAGFWVIAPVFIFFILSLLLWLLYSSSPLPKYLNDEAFIGNLRPLGRILLFVGVAITAALLTWILVSLLQIKVTDDWITVLPLGFAIAGSALWIAHTASAEKHDKKISRWITEALPRTNGVPNAFLPQSQNRSEKKGHAKKQLSMALRRILSAYESQSKY